MLWLRAGPVLHYLKSCIWEGSLAKLANIIWIQLSHQYYPKIHIPVGQLSKNQTLFLFLEWKEETTEKKTLYCFILQGYKDKPQHYVAVQGNMNGHMEPLSLEHDEENVAGFWILCNFEKKHLLKRNMLSQLGICAYIVNSEIFSLDCNLDKMCYVTGPTTATLRDMWRMLWQLNSNRIIMLTGLTENKKVNTSIFNCNCSIHLA